jgi:hypothetical protein
MSAARIVSNTTIPYGGNEISNKLKKAVHDLKSESKIHPNFHLVKSWQ